MRDQQVAEGDRGTSGRMPRLPGTTRGISGGEVRVPRRCRQAR